MPSTIFAEFYTTEISFNHKIFSDITAQRVHPHTHNGFEMIYVKNGNLTYRINDKSFSVKKDSLIMTRPGNMHLMDFDDRAVYERYDIIFDTDIIHREIYRGLSEDVHIVDCRYNTVYEYFDKMDFYCRHCSGDTLRNILSHLADEVFYYLVLANKPDNTIEANKNSVLSEILEYIDSHIQVPFSLNTMCNELYISRTTLHKVFLEHLNITPKKYIRTKRLYLAQKMLREGKNATSIYEECGFFDYSSFFRSYKAEFGHPPSDEKTNNTIQTIAY